MTTHRTRIYDATHRACLATTLLLALMGSARSIYAQSNSPDSVRVYLLLVEEATRQLDAQNWTVAAGLWERAVKINPTVPSHWLALGRARFNLQKYGASIAPFSRAFDLGAGTPNVIAYNIARAHSYGGAHDSALVWLERALKLGFRDRRALLKDESFAALRADPRFARIGWDTTSGRVSSTDRWREDLAFLEDEVLRLHASSSDKPSRVAEFTSAIGDLRSRLPRLAENEIVVGVMRSLAVLGDGHTGSWPEAVSGWGGRAVPVQFFDFSDGMYVIAADSVHSDLVGAKVTAIAALPVDRVRESIDSLVGKDHALGARLAFTRFVRYPQVLNGLGLTPRADALSLTYLKAGRERNITIAVEPSGSDYHRLFGRPKWVSVLDGPSVTLPLYLRNRERFYWFTHLPAENAIYFQLNRTRNDASESLAAFTARLFRAADSSAAERLILDLRHNYGGNTALIMPLVHEVMRRERFAKNGGLFVLIGRTTFSAAQNAATLLERHANPVFVGEPSGSSPNFVGEDNSITLPYSQMQVSISDLYWQSSWPQDRRAWIAPHLYFPPTFEAFRNRRDPALDAIRALLQRPQ